MPTHRFEFDWGLHTMLRLLDSYEFETVLDIGSGSGEHGRFFRHFGKKVYTVDLHKSADYLGDFMDVKFDRTFDVVWCSHVLEHQRNVGSFLEKLYGCLPDRGILAISGLTHPRARVMSGHVTSWNAGLLCYNLVLAGFNCKEAQVLQTRELSLIVRKSRAQGADVLAAAPYCRIEELAQYFPFPVADGGNAEVLEAKWGDKDYELPPAPVPGRIEVASKWADIRLD